MQTAVKLGLQERIDGTMTLDLCHTLKLVRNHMHVEVRLAVSTALSSHGSVVSMFAGIVPDVHLDLWAEFGFEFGAHRAFHARRLG